MPVEHRHKKRIFFHKNLETCSHVFLRKITIIKKGLECPYSGPHKVLNRISDRVYKIDVTGEPKKISVENIKQAYFASYEDSIGGHGEQPSSVPSSDSQNFTNSNSQTNFKPILGTYVNKKKKLTFDPKLSK